MKRRRFIVGTIALSSVLSGCLGGDSDGSEGSSAAQTSDLSQSPQSNILSLGRNVNVSDGSFTETDRSTPLESETFIKTYKQIVQSKGIQIEWATNVRRETIEVLYPADNTNHEQRMKLFVDAFVELTYHAGGTDRDMQFVVKKSGDMWYEWHLTDDRTREYLRGDISRAELLTTVNETVELRGGSDRTQTDIELELDSTPDRSNGDADDGHDANDTDTEVDNDGGDSVTTDTEDGGRSDSGAGFAVRIRYETEWSGVVSSGERSRSVDGSGTETFTIEDEHPFVISANAQKLDAGSGTLTVQVLADDTVRKEASTDAEYGIASVSYTP